MRIASSHYHNTMNTALQTASARVGEVLQQMASGQRLMVPSDDPVRQVRVSRLQREDAAIGQYRDNIGALQSRLSQNEALLGSMTQDMLQARDLLVWASNGGNTAEDVAAMADAMSALRDSLYYSANSRDQEGRYMFSGTATATPAVALDTGAAAGARYSFGGNTVTQKVMVGNGITQPANVNVSDLHELLNLLDLTVETLRTPGASVADPVTRDTLRNTLDGLDVTLGTVGDRIASLGGAQNILETLDGNHENVSLANQQALIDLGQLDYGDAAVRLNGYTTALQATQKAYGQVSRLSLFDAL
ncbi:flagellar hook-associated protein FlgL [Aquabacterium sp. A7-Y]|uniref:flagellar hook-associated protein FlgL n=1 Tax=Aquabacterium sp. A7-Y TaxID=1349605 RepID=UPI00223D86C6|nr:flagellar hook-associated protein FlgL [Aquabacterium sp. A7-Y]MCW7536545.1 flagellar hook-associated protein FlgL [Aquabacterium sp. A7-Y]